LASVAAAQDTQNDTGNDHTRSISLTVPAGVPLRLYLIKRVSKRFNAPVEARLLTPVYAFDHEVIPAGTQVLGHVSAVQPVSGWARARAVLGGDFSPLHVAQVEFTSLLLPDGRPMELRTIESPGLNSLVPLKPPKQRSQAAQGNNGGVLNTAKQKARDTVDAQIAGVKSNSRHGARTGQEGVAVRLRDVQAALSPPIHTQSDPVRRGAQVSAQFWLGDGHSGLSGFVRFAAVTRQHRACEAAHASGFDEFDAGPYSSSLYFRPTTNWFCPRGRSWTDR
jgi:hypothetical protein